MYKVLCPKRKTYALKRIRLQGREKETIAGFMDEIRLLQGLRMWDNIIQLVDAGAKRRTHLRRVGVRRDRSGAAVVKGEAGESQGGERGQGATSALG